MTAADLEFISVSPAVIRRSLRRWGDSSCVVACPCATIHRRPSILHEEFSPIREQNSGRGGTPFDIGPRCSRSSPPTAREAAGRHLGRPARAAISSPRALGYLGGIMHERRGRIHFAYDAAYRDMLQRAGLFDFEATLSRTDLDAAKTVLSSRHTHRWVIDGVPHYLKRYFEIPGREAFRDLFRSRRHRSPVVREWYALRRLGVLAIPSPKAILAAEEVSPFGIRRGYLLTLGLDARATLEEEMEVYAAPVQIALREKKRRLIREISRLLRLLHVNGIAHRDFYAAHLFFAPDERGLERLHVLDLNRAEINDTTSYRRRIKDLAALDLSVPHRVASTSDRLRFLLLYLFPFERPAARRFIRDIAAKSKKMRGHVERQISRGVPNFHVNE
jgi:heptose I phosphotransferase